MEDRKTQIAVVGMSCRFPGADGTDRFWRNLQGGVESVATLSEAQLAAAGVAGETLADPAYVRAYGVLEGACDFDAPFFGVSRRDAAVLDPQHRVFLECAWAALEDAGCDPARFPGAIGVYAGSGFSTWVYRVLANPELAAQVGWAPAVFGSDKDFLATRVSYKLGLRGPSVAVQTACSTSLVAIHLACQSLLHHECDLALAGGVTILADPVGHAYQEGGILSPDGHCRAFDARAAGTVGGSGAGVVVLKRMADALRDGDVIHAVVRGSAINNDGAGKVGFTAPSVEGQAQVIVEAMELAGVEPSTVGYVETHGTATPLGDPIEIAALLDAFGPDGRPGRVALGALKSNLGHLDTAAGVAAFIKVVLALKHGAIPPTLHFERPNPETGLEGSPFFVNAELRPWERNGVPRRAGVSSFGMGGTNAHAVLEEAPEPPPSEPVDAVQLLVLSARAPAALEQMRAGLAAHLAGNPGLSLADVAFTLQEGRAAHPHRWAAVARDIDEALDALGSAPRRKPASRRAKERPPVAFLFPGQGTQYAGMAGGLYEAEPVFRDALDRCAGLLLPELGLDLRAVLFPAAGDEEAASAALRETRLTQPALFAVEYSLARLWMHRGVEPAAMLGHSIGEYVAACLAGVFTPEAALRLVAARGRLVQGLPGGAMAAVPLPEADVRALLPAGVSLAAVNGASACVVSGDFGGVDEMERVLAERGVEARRLHTSHAFHSAAMEPILDAFAGEVRRANPAAPSIPFLSNVTGDWITADEARDPAYWVRHLRETVRFADGVGRLLEDGGRVLLEVGPGETLGAFARRHPAGGAGRLVARTLPSATQREESVVTALEAAGALWTAGVAVGWPALRGPARRRKATLPVYPFQREEYRVPPFVERVPSAPSAAPHPAPVQDQASAPAPASYGPACPPEPNGGTLATETIATAGRGSRISADLTTLFAKLLGSDASELEADSNFLELGADSLLLMQLSRNVESTFGVRVPFRRLLEGLSTIAELAAHLDREMPPEPEPILPPIAAAPVAAPPVAAPTSIAAPAMESGNGGPPAPRFSPGDAPAPAAAVQELLAQQLATMQSVMQAQLELLRGGVLPSAPIPSPAAAAAPPSAPTAGPPAPSTTVPAPPAPSTAAPSTPASAGDGAAHGPHRPISQTLLSGGAATERQARHYEALMRAYNARTRGSKEYAARHRGGMADNRASLNFRLATKELLYPVVGDRSQGSRMWDVDGNEYIDFTIGFGVHFFGHRPPFVMEAVEAQLRRGLHTGPQSDLAGPTADLFGELVGVERVTFCNTGSEAVMTAVRVARTVTGRDRIVLFEGSYHGCFDGILAARAPGKGAPRTRPASPGTPRGMVEDVVVLPYGTPETLEWLQANADTLAAVLVEAVQSANPEHQPAEFLREVRALTERSGTVLVFDEMITGLRLQLRGAQGWFGVEADLATYGKVIGGGFPLGILAGRARLMDAIDGGGWSYGDDSYPAADQTFFAGTFCKHPVVMAAANAVLRHLRERGPALYDELNARTARLVAGLRQVLREERVPIVIRHTASMFRFAFRPEDTWVDLLFYHMLMRGIYVWEGRGCFVSTAHTDEDCDAMVRALRESIGALREGGYLPEEGGGGTDGSGGGAAVAVPADLKLFQPASARASDGPSADDDSSGAPSGIRSFPLTPAQKQVWLHAQMGDDASRAYNEQFIVGLKEALDADVLRAAVGDLVAHHGALRTVFDPLGEVQRVLPVLPALPVFATPAARTDEALERAMDDAVAGVFDLASGPLFRVYAHPRGEGRTVLQFVVHHIVADGVSTDILEHDLEVALRARAAGQAPRLAPAMQFDEYAARMVAYAAEHAGAEAEWLARFAGVAPLVLSTDRPRPAFPTYRAALAGFTVGAPLADRLREAGRRQGCTLFTTLAAGLLATLHRVAGQDDFVIGISSAGRPFPGSESLVGHCVDVLPLRSRVQGEPPALGAFLARVRGSLLDAYEHEVFTAARLIPRLDLPRGPGAPPLVSVILSLEPGAPAGGGEGDAAGARFAGVAREPAPGTSTPFTRFDLQFDAVDTGGEVLVLCSFKSDLFHPATAERLLERLYAVLEQLATAPETRLDRLELLGAHERRLVLEEWSRTPGPAVAEPRVHRRFEAQAARTPGAPALVSATGTLDYAGLNRRANRLAHRLRALGVGPDVRVGICLPRGAEMVISVLAVLKAGGAYVPLDPAYPAARLAYMLDDSGATVVLTRPSLAGTVRVPAGVAVVAVDDGAGETEDGDADLAGGAEPENLAYVLYTSGSTGTPKGVAVEHAQLGAYLDWAGRLYPAAGSAVHSSLSFDLTVTSLFVPLLGGGTVELVEDDAAVEALARALERGDRYALLKLTPAHLRALGAALEGRTMPGGAECLVVGGEPLLGEHLDPWRARMPDARVVNEYGPTETVVGCSVHAVRLGDTFPGPLPIGRPAENAFLYVLEAGFHPAPVGMAGELYVGGPQVTRGYLGRPALTAGRFVPDPFAVLPGARLYRTGDQARWRADGTLEYLGRLDGQVKVRGFRVEPGEVEAALRGAPGVADCAVVARGEAGGETRLVAYVVGGAGPEALQAHLRGSLPEHMVPGAFVALERIPLTPNGKLDRAALPAPGAEPAAAHEYVGPRTPAEDVLARLWAEALGRERVGVDDNFFALGADSILAIKVAAGARRAGVKVSPRQMFDHPTVASLAAVARAVEPKGEGAAKPAASAPEVEAGAEAGETIAPPAAAPAGPVRTFPLTPAQRQVWVHAQLGDDASRAYNQQFVLGLRGRLEPSVLRAALEDVVAHHEGLRTVFAPRGDVQHVLPALPLLPLLVGDAAADDPARLAESLDGALRGVFDLAAGPLFRVHLHANGPGRQVLQLVVHHLVADGLGIDLVARDLELACRARARGVPPRLPGAMQPHEYAARLSEQVARNAAYEAGWLARFAGAAPLLLPADRPRPRVPGHRAGTAVRAVGRPLATRLREVSRAQGCTLFTTLVAGMLATLHRVTGRDDLLVGVSSAGRPFPGSETVVAHCVDALPLRSRADGGATLFGFLREVRGGLLDAYEHDVFAQARLQEALPLPRGPGVPPLINVVFNLEPGGAGEPATRFAGVEIEPAGSPTLFTKVDLEVDITEVEGALHLNALYSADLFDPGTVERLLGQVERVLERLAGEHDVPLAALELMGDDDRRRVLEEWSRGDDIGTSAVPVPVHALFAAQAARTPDAPALRAGGRDTSYRALDQAANRLAHHLAARGVGPETRVGVVAARSPGTVEALLAVLKAGGAFVPLDPAYPAERLRYMLADSGAELVIAPDGLPDALSAAGVPGLLDPRAEADAIAARPAEAPGTSTDPDSLAYVIYTSGSTGLPRGVMVAHRGVPALARAQIDAFGIEPGTRVLQFASFSFDAAVSELFTALLAGATLVLGTRDELHPGPGLIDTLRRERIGVATLPPSALAALSPAGLPALRTVVSAGEAVESAVVEAWGAGRVFINAYGPTEATVCATFAVCPADGRTPPIGRPLRHARVYVVDGAGEPCAPGVAGELRVGGDGVARGYLGRPALTAERFVPDPFGPAGGRLYRTGDLARWRDDGALVFAGRVDRQVKIRGYRVEPGEVEAALRAHPAVRACAVAAREDAPGETRLAAYVVGEVDADALREHLRATLPEHMVPAAFTRLDALPLSPSGKVDHAALPAPAPASAPGRYLAPRDAVEETLAAIWAEVLGVERVGVDDSFFDLGGDSILAIQVAAQARHAGVEINPAQLFDHRTVAGLAAVAGRAEAAPAAGAPVEDEGEAPLTPIQAWFLEQGHPVPAHYNQSVLLELDSAVDDAALDAALAAVLGHHDAVRLRLRRTDAGWEPWYADGTGIELERVHLAGLAAGEQDRAQAEAAERFQASLHLESGPLGRAVLFDRGERGRVLLLILHHLAVDTVSWGILRDDLERALEQAGAGKPVELGPGSTPFAEWSRALRAYAASDALAAEVEHWTAQGDRGVAPLPREEAGAGAGPRTVAVRLDAAETRALLQEVPPVYRTQINDVLLAALAGAVREVAGSPRVRLALEGHGREEEVGGDLDLTRTVGWFTSLYPVVLDVQGAAGPGDVLKRVKEQLRAIPRRGIGYGVLRWMGPDPAVRAALAAQAEPEIAFNYLGRTGDGAAAARPSLRFAAGPRGREWAPENRSPSLVDVVGDVVDGCLELRWTADGGMHATAERLAAAYHRALRGLIAHCREEGAGGCTPGDFPLAGATQAEIDAAVGNGRGVDDLYPLSPMQEGMLFHAVYGGDYQEYQTRSAQRLEGPLDVELFRRAWAEVARRHAAFRTDFAWDGLRRPLQRVHASVQLPWRLEDWRHLDAAAQDAALTRFLDDDGARGFDLKRAPLVRLALLRVADDAWWFVWSQHHLPVDGWSCARIESEALGLYHGWSEGAPVRLGRVRPYRDYIAWLERQDRGAAERYWRRVLDGFTAPTPLPVDRPAAAGAVVRHARQATHLAAPLARALQAAARGGQVTLNTLLLGAWGILLSRWAGEDDVVLGTTVSGRQAPLEGVEEMVGLFINTLPVRMRVRGGDRLAAWLGGVQRAQAESREHEHAPLLQVQGWSQVPRGTPLFESHFIFENYPIEARATGGGGDGAPARLRVTDWRGVEWNNFPLSLLVAPGPEILFILSYDANRFDAGTITRMLGQLRRVLEQVAAGGDPALSSLTLLDEEERRRVVTEWNRTDAPYPADQCIHHLFAAQVARTPDAPAVVFGDARLTYAELDARANRLSHHLRTLGVGPEVRVGVCLERGLEVMTAILGVLKAGGAYVPVDPSHPAERIRWVLDDSGVEIVLTQRRLVDGLALPASIRPVLVDAEWDAIALHPAGEPESCVTAENLAYVIYTSGSTGRPKGVAMHHRGVANYIHWGIGHYGADRGNGAPVFSSMAVDLTLTNLLPLFAGRPVWMLPEENAVEALAGVLRGGPGFGLIKITPTHLALLTPLLTPEEARGAALTLVVGADFLPAEPTVFWQDHAPGVRLINEYGPTETVVGCSAYTLPPGVHRHGPVPVGGAIQNLKFYVVDAHLQPVPAGVPGELCIGGAGVARGYLGRPALSAEKFVPDPFAAPGARMYRSGDRARWLEGGNLLILGRADNQVKVRGYRVELGEVEAALRLHPGVSGAVVVLREDVPGDRRLVGYVVGHAEPEALRAHLRRSLPEHMVPAAFVRLDTLPVTPTGKFDPRTLPAPEYGGDDARYVAPRTPVEAALERIWAGVLRLERVGVDDSFFELGGDSILSIQVVSQARRAGVEISPRQLFEHPTIAGLAAVAAGAGDGGAARRPAQGRETGGVPLTPIQARFFAQGHPAPWHENQSVLIAVDGAVPDETLETALAAVLEHHDALRLRFRREEGGWVQWHAAEAGIALERIDLSGDPDAEQDAAMDEIGGARQASLSLENGPLGRAVLFDRGARGRVLLLAVHHLVVDAVSWRVVRDDLERACRQARAGEPVALGARSTSFRQWARALRAYAAGDAIRAEVPHWLAQGSQGIAPLPVDGEGEGTVGTARTVTVTLEPEETRALLTEVPAAYHTQINDVLLCALAQAVSAWTGSPRVRLALEGHGREEEIADGVDLTRTLGWFTTLYPVVLDLEGAAGPGERLKRVKEQLRAIPRRGIGYGALRWMSPDPGVRAALAAQDEPGIVFNYLGQFGGDEDDASWLRFAGGARGNDSAPVNRRSHPLAVDGGIGGGCLRLSWTYGEGVHRRETVERLAHAYLDALRGLIAHCREAGAGGYTPSDFPLAGLAQDELDALLAGGRGVEDVYPLSPMQEGMLFHALHGGGSQAYQVQVAMRMEGLDAALFRRAWAEVAARHTALRTSFAWEGLRRPLQRVHASVEIPWVEEDWTGLPEDEQEAALDRFLAADLARGFDLRQAPLLRCALFRVGGAHWFVRSQHHLLTDGWTANRVAGEVFHLYQARGAGTPPRLGPVRPFRDYIAWLGRQDEQAAERYWRGVLAGFGAPTPLAVDRPAGPGAGARHARLDVVLPPERAGRLDAFARRARVTLNTLLQGAWALLLARYSGEDDVVFGATVSVRPATLEGVDEMAGLFLNTLPVRVRVDGGRPLDAWLGDLQRGQAGAREHDYAPLVQVQGWSEVPRGTPLFESLFIFENYPAAPAGTVGGEEEKGGTVAAPRVTAARAVERTTYPLTFMAAPGDGLLLCLSYDESRFDAAAIERMMGHLERLLDGAAGGAGAPVSALDLLGAAEREQVLGAWSHAARPYDDAPAHVLFARIARATPDAPALLHGGGVMTYGELDRRADALARRLRALGVGPEVPVGVCVPRAPELLVGVLAIWKAGGAFVPLDPAYPPDRLGWMVEDAALSVVVTAGDAAGALPAHAAVLVHADLIDEVDEVDDASAPVEGLAPDGGVTGASLAYVIYTSGSTGRPKGVLVQHGSLANLLAATREAFGVGPGDVVPPLASYAFDIWLFEALLPLTSGAAVRLVAPERVLDAPALLDEVADATLLHAVPALMAEVLRAERERPRLGRLRRAFTGGDRVPAALLAEMRAVLPVAETHVLYGPTEATILASIQLVAGDGGVEGHPIGRPLGNVRLYVADPAGRAQPPGVPGELWIGGAGVARGYRGRPGLTAERFVPDPFSPDSGARRYRTGDRARWRDDGTLEYLGRLDRQVKVRGFRIEPGEVEAVLRGHAGVREAVVVAREDVPGEPRLVAYVVPGDADAVELWPSIGEHPVYDDLIYYGLTGDTRRMESYRAALKGQVEGRVVVDVGTGGDAVLARMCVEAGARKVYAVEMLPASCESARRRVAQEGMEDRIEVVLGDVRTVALPEPADVVVSEIVEAIAGAEGAAVLLEHARRLLRPGGVFIPERSLTWVAAATLPDALHDDPAFTETAAHYVRRIFESVGHPFDLRLTIRNFPPGNLLSGGALFEELDFRAPVPAEYDAAVTLEVTRAGRFDGLLLWLALDMGGGETLDILRDRTAWFPAWVPAFHPGVAVRPGDRVEVRVRSRISPDGVHPDYFVEGVLHQEGREVPFAHDSVHHAPVHGANPYHARLFEGGEVATARTRPLEAELKELAERHLPAHMVPGAWVRLERLPLTAHGKVDPRALPAPGAAPAGAHVEPRTVVEEALAGIWAQVLRAGRVGATDDFFALGGHSLLVMRLLAAVEAAFGVALSIRDVFAHPELGAMAAEIERRVTEYVLGLSDAEAERRAEPTPATGE